MSAVQKSTDVSRSPKVNVLGLDKNEYRGKPSTLCKGCGHDSISARIINVAWDLGLDQSQVIKMSGREFHIKMSAAEMIPARRRTHQDIQVVLQPSAIGR